MRTFLKPATGLTCLFTLTVTGCSSGSGGTSDAAPAAPEHTSAAPSQAAASSTSYAPYVSATTASDTDSAGSPTTYNLAFVVSDGSGCTPKWNGAPTPSATRR